MRAAGASWSARAPAGTEVLLVHRPRYDDWSFPKGKRDGDETDEETALREVLEETGLACVLGRELGEARYRDSRGRPKVVRYWLMTPDPTTTGPGSPPTTRSTSSVGARPREAAKLLTYAHDRALLSTHRRGWEAHVTVYLCATPGPGAAAPGRATTSCAR